MESHEHFKNELRELLKSAIKVCCFRINGLLVLRGKVTTISDLNITDYDTEDGDHSTLCDICIELKTKDGNRGEGCKVRIDYIVKGKEVYVKYPIMVDTRLALLEEILT